VNDSNRPLLERAREALGERTGATSYLAELITHAPTRQAFEQMLGPRAVAQLLEELVTPRLQDFFVRRRRRWQADWGRLLLSQGYKQGLRWRGIALGKTSYDTCIQQQLIAELRPATIIEFGTGYGASALFYLDQCRALGIDTRIITMDIGASYVSEQLAAEPDIEFIHGDAARVSELLPASRLATLPHPWLVVEDCHEHVAVIVQHLHGLLHAGDYLIIEDIGLAPAGMAVVEQVMGQLPAGSLAVDTAWTDMFGYNMTCAPDAILRKC
jgi:cephalosporin hydroxylase